MGRRGWTFGAHWRGRADGDGVWRGDSWAVGWREKKKKMMMNGVLEGRVWSLGGGGRGGGLSDGAVNVLYQKRGGGGKGESQDIGITVPKGTVDDLVRRLR